MALPIPLPPPVTIATLFSKRTVGFLREDYDQGNCERKHFNSVIKIIVYDVTPAFSNVTGQRLLRHDRKRNKFQLVE
jgi:hypothetical protein